MSTPGFRPLIRIDSRSATPFAGSSANNSSQLNIPALANVNSTNPGTAVSFISSTSEMNNQLEVLNHEQNILKELKDMELLPLLLDLIENLRLGKISPKDFDNAAGRIRVRLNRVKMLINQIEGLNESTESRIKKMEELNGRILVKKQVLGSFKESVERHFTS